MKVYVIGLAVHPPADRVADKRLEEMVLETARAALDDAAVSRAEIDHVTIAACDEIDGRSISSMLLAAPAGAYLRDEIKCTDSGLMGLCLGGMRIGTGLLDLGLVVSWSKSSEAPLEDVMRMRCEPFYTRPIGLNMTIADGLFAQAVAARFALDGAAADQAARAAGERAARNPRGIRRKPPRLADIAASPFRAAPLRAAHQAPPTDGAVAFVIASERWLDKRRRTDAHARLAGLGWRTEGYDLGGTRLSGLAGFTGALSDALGKAGLGDPTRLDLIELDGQTAWHELAFTAALGTAAPHAISPSGGPFAQNPYFCSGLVNAAEAVLQVAGRAGPVQVSDARYAAAHGCHGFAQQGNVVAVFARA